MRVVFGKNNGLAQLFAALHFNAVCHQMVQHFIHRVGVKQPTIQRGAVYLVRRFAGSRVAKFFFVFSFFAFR